jgi:hypothetical protein
MSSAGPSIDLMPDAPEGLGTVCDRATSRWMSFAKWRNLWTLLLFVFGSFLILIAAGLVLFIVFDVIEGAVASGAAAVVDTAIVGFVKSRRDESVAEEDKAFGLVLSACEESTANQIQAARQHYKVLGVR